MDSIKQIGFAGAIITCKSVNPLAENQFGLIVIFKVNN
jgi:hypothetical protein